MPSICLPTELFYYSHADDSEMLLGPDPQAEADAMQDTMQ